MTTIPDHRVAAFKLVVNTFAQDGRSAGREDTLHRALDALSVPPEDESAYRGLFENVIDYAEGGHVSLGLGASAAQAVNGAGAGAPTAEVLDGAAFVLDAPDHVPAVWGRGGEVLWSEGEYLLLTGGIGAGKSTIAQQLIRARLGLGDEVLGYPVTPGERNVLLLALDRPPQIRRSLRRMFTEDDRDALARLKVATALTADIVRTPAHLAELVRANDADTLIADSLKDVAYELESGPVGQAIADAFRRVIDAGAQVAGVHHHRKATGENRKPKTLADVYGSMAITAGAGSVACLWGEAGAEIVELTHLKPPAEIVGPLTIEHDHQAGRSTVRAAPTVWDLLMSADLATGITAPDIARTLYGRKPTDAEVERVRRKLERHVSEGHARRTPAKAARSRHLPPRHRGPTVGSRGSTVVTHGQPTRTHETAWLCTHGHPRGSANPRAYRGCRAWVAGSWAESVEKSHAECGGTNPPPGGVARPPYCTPRGVGVPRGRRGRLAPIPASFSPSVAFPDPPHDLRADACSTSFTGPRARRQALGGPRNRDAQARPPGVDRPRNWEAVAGALRARPSGRGVRASDAGGLTSSTGWAPTAPIGGSAGG